MLAGGGGARGKRRRRHRAGRAVDRAALERSGSSDSARASRRTHSASHIAGRTVSVDCESPSDWEALVTQAGGDPNQELGFVATQWNSVSGQLVSLSNVALLSSGVCLALDSFAQATSKPTGCLRAAAASAALRAGTRLPRSHATTRNAAIATFGLCYLGSGGATRMPAPYWADYSLGALAILTLAHEAIHLGGIVGGTLSTGTAVGDPQAEAKAECYGMQWMPYVAESLGDNAQDAQSIAAYTWARVYPLLRTSDPAYWSADCRPGGPLYIRPGGAGPDWP